MKVLRILLLIFLAPLASAEVKVVVLHPLLGDLAKRVGGEQVAVVDLVGPQGDPHKFEPAAKDLQAAKGADLYLVSGKGLEPYLKKLQNIVGKDRVVEVGKTLPTLQAEVLCDHGEHAHVHEQDDPHWWHSIDCWRRAARVVSKELSRIDPANAEIYAERTKKVRAELAELRVWATKELSTVPKENRTLATAHAAFAYFCNEHEWKMLAVQGLNREQVEAFKFVKEVVDTIRKEKVLAVFPEKRSNPKALKTVAEGAGVKIGAVLIADGSESIDAMFRHNVNAIVAALGKK